MRIRTLNFTTLDTFGSGAAAGHTAERVALVRHVGSGEERRRKDGVEEKKNGKGMVMNYMYTEWCTTSFVLVSCYGDLSGTNPFLDRSELFETSISLKSRRTLSSLTSRIRWRPSTHAPAHTQRSDRSYTGSTYGPSRSNRLAGFSFRAPLLSACSRGLI